MVLFLLNLCFLLFGFFLVAEGHMLCFIKSSLAILEYLNEHLVMWFFWRIGKFWGFLTDFLNFSTIGDVHKLRNV
jgi:hypothetical protein